MLEFKEELQDILNEAPKGIVAIGVGKVLFGIPQVIVNRECSPMSWLSTCKKINVLYDCVGNDEDLGEPCSGFILDSEFTRFMFDKIIERE